MDEDSKKVVIIDIKMPFSSMVIFMVKWVLASIPAMLILGALGVAVVMGLQMSGLGEMLGGLLKGLLGGTPPPS
ncbi:MAG: hypothetical protein BWK79_19265 [Beggiatoa sp. IS2]|nr:MAG: hypothetical protein BWK79_19265 [Beggiatoa sp. IS2]